MTIQEQEYRVIVVLCTSVCICLTPGRSAEPSYDPPTGTTVSQPSINPRCVILPEVTLSEKKSRTEKTVILPFCDPAETPADITEKHRGGAAHNDLQVSSEDDPGARACEEYMNGNFAIAEICQKKYISLLEKKKSYAQLSASLLFLCQILNAQEKYQAAIHYCQRVEESAPCASTEKQLAELYRKAGQRTKAIGILQQRLNHDLKQENVEAEALADEWINLASEYHQQNMLIEAKCTYEKAEKFLKEKSTEIEIHTLLKLTQKIQVELGEIWLGLNEPAKAESAYLESLKTIDEQLRLSEQNFRGLLYLPKRAALIGLCKIYQQQGDLENLKKSQKKLKTLSTTIEQQWQH